MVLALWRQSKRQYARAILTLIGILSAGTVVAQSPHAHHMHHGDSNVLPLNHAPIGIMGDHLHQEGEWMWSYRQMRMTMRGNLQGSSDIASEGILDQGLRVIPQEMTTDMQMLCLMFAPRDNLNVMLMANYLEKSMGHRTYDPTGTQLLGSFVGKTQGFSDSKIEALYRFRNQGPHLFHFHLGLSLPTGNYKETGTVLTPMDMPMNTRLPYPMQLGSGSYALTPGVTYTGQHQRWDWGSQIKGSHTLDRNKAGYRIGDSLQLSSWGSYRLSPQLAGSLRLSYQQQDRIEGEDQLITTLPTQTANTLNSGGEQWRLGAGFNVIGSDGHRFSIEYEETFDQHVNGIQLKMQNMLTLGYQYSF